MFHPDAVPPVREDETVARFVLHKDHVRADHTVKHHEFVPYKLQDLSVTRHAMATESEIWAEGREVARLRDRPLLGRVDLLVRDCHIGRLAVIAAPLPASGRRVLANPNHANVSQYPPSKPDQLSLAQKIAAKATRLLPPTATDDDGIGTAGN